LVLVHGYIPENIFKPGLHRTHLQENPLIGNTGFKNFPGRMLTVDAFYFQ
jgi:hypothetical protein